MLLRLALAYALVALVGCAVGPAPRQDAFTGNPTGKEVDVYLLAGQSNMVGVGRSELLPESATTAPNVFLYHSAAVGAQGSEHQWLPLRPAGWKRGWRGEGTQGFGVELSLGASLARANPGRRVYLIKHAVGGTGLYNHWNPGTGKQFRRFDKLVQRGLAELESKGLRPIVRGVFWQQGEEDSKRSLMADVYLRRLEGFILRLRRDLSPYAPQQDGTRIRFVIGQVSPDASPGSLADRRYPYRDIVRAAQLAIADALPNVASVPTDGAFETHASDSDGYSDLDNIHFNGAGLVLLGERMAAAYGAR